jgi:hypothetical protein
MRKYGIRNFIIVAFVVVVVAIVDRIRQGSNEDVSGKGKVNIANWEKGEPNIVFTKYALKGEFPWYSLFEETDEYGNYIVRLNDYSELTNYDYQGVEGDTPCYLWNKVATNRTIPIMPPHKTWVWDPEHYIDILADDDDMHTIKIPFISEYAIVREGDLPIFGNIVDSLLFTKQFLEACYLGNVNSPNNHNRYKGRFDASTGYSSKYRKVYDSLSDVRSKLRYSLKRPRFSKKFVNSGISNSIGYEFYCAIKSNISTKIANKQIMRWNIVLSNGSKIYITNIGGTRVISDTPFLSIKLLYYRDKYEMDKTRFIENWIMDKHPLPSEKFDSTIISN